MYCYFMIERHKKYVIKDDERVGSFGGGVAKCGEVEVSVADFWEGAADLPR